MTKSKNKQFDIVIIGAGIAGMTAAIYAGRAGKTVGIIDKNGFGGQILSTPLIENYPGFTKISGADLAANIYEQMSSLPNVEHITSEAMYIGYDHGLFKVSIEDHSLVCGLAIIFAGGSMHKTLALDTKDVYYCVTCDGPLFKDKPVVVMGSGNTGATYALELASYCKHVYLCDITLDMMCEKILQDKILKTKNISWLPNCTIQSVQTNQDKALESVTLNTLETLKCNAVFAAIGMLPQTEVIKDYVKLDEKNYAVESTLPGVFIAGDCGASAKQAIIAAGSGANAALDAIKFVNLLN